ncbi:MAG TPA: inositol monophosphatase family protein [Gammaproteobacteria bacterium]|nr:inositol monophosphatase family protein [Gammaproteobacteria bacterium]
MMPDLQHVQSLLIATARTELLPRLAQVSRQTKADGSVVTAADLAMQKRLTARLQAQWPYIRLLGEEMSAAEQTHLLADRQPLWCLDPLDGTSNFAAGIPYFAVSLALIQQGRVVLGVVYDPLRDECFAASDDTPATLNGDPLQRACADLALSQSTAVVDFKRLPVPLVARLASAPPYASQRSFGAVALDWCWLAAGRGHLYLHGKQNLWDYAAGHFIFQHTSGHAATLTGEPVFTPALQARTAVAAVNSELFTAWHAWLQTTLTDT